MGLVLVLGVPYGAFGRCLVLGVFAVRHGKANRFLQLHRILPQHIRPTFTQKSVHDVLLFVLGLGRGAVRVACEQGFVRTKRFCSIGMHTFPIAQCVVQKPVQQRLASGIGFVQRFVQLLNGLLLRRSGRCLNGFGVFLVEHTGFPLNPFHSFHTLLTMGLGAEQPL